MILKISLRNLIRQKRRNLLLGLSIAFGMSILTIANAFSAGMSDLLLNRVMVWITGHIRVTMQEKDERAWTIIRDKDRMKQLIRQNIEGELEIFEDVRAEGRALGNGSVESIVLKGVELSEGFFRDIKTSAGNPQDILNPKIENPLILYAEVAENLHVQVNDRIQVSFENVYRQVQSAQFTVVAILDGNLPFISSAAYTHIDVLKPLLGYEAHESGALNIVMKDLKNPAFVLEQAERLHYAFIPEVAGYIGTVRSDSREERARVFAVTLDEYRQQIFRSHLELVEGSLEDTLKDESAVLLSQSFATLLGLRVGDRLRSVYVSRFSWDDVERNYRVGGIFQANRVVAQDMILLNPRAFISNVFSTPPAEQVTLDRSDLLSRFLLPEWTLLERSPNREALTLKYDELRNSPWHGAVLDVQTMYELGEGILNFELALDVISLAAVLLLFFIILIGVVNTLRMTIRERTREIGTLRAIGMQRGAVRASFLTEVLLLTLISCAAGVLAGYGAMSLLGLLSFDAEGILLFLLVDTHLYFVPTLFDILKNILIITGIVFLTAILPASHAAKMSVIGALRHYE